MWKRVQQFLWAGLPVPRFGCVEAGFAGLEAPPTWTCVVVRRSCKLALAALLGLTLPARAGLTDRLGGAFRGTSEDALSPAASALVARAFADLGAAPLEDYHAHLVGIGADGTGAAINAEMTTWRHPFRRFKAGVFLSATGVPAREHFDGDYVARLVRLARGCGHPVRIHLLALDHNYNSDGTINTAKTEFYMPNARVVAVARQYPDVFVPVISVHPDRPDALAELETWAGQGVRFIKWLPNAQNIDPAQPRYDAFYGRLRALNMVLLAHTGAEGAVAAAGAQELGNPLRLRRPLDASVRVIMAHCASRGRSADLDHPGTRADNFDLFLRMMDDPRYRGLLFADISALAQWNRLPRPLLEILRRPDLQARLVNGSDYPMPALNCTISLRKLVQLGVLAGADRAPLTEIYRHNPLLFDFVLKRTLRAPTTGARLPAELFVEHPSLSASPAAAKKTTLLAGITKEQGT
ncbi:MAG: amidohydrolase family protein [Kiritimatiellaeota bacterium]|nr:amidohydrolase family protein [Kiritimatiellota bacterium]